MAGKHDSAVKKIKAFVQRRCQYAQLLPGTSGMQPQNQVFNYHTKHQNAQPVPNHKVADKTNTTKEAKRTFEGNCRHSNFLGHKWIDCRKHLRDEANGINTKTQQRPQQENNNGQQQQSDKPRYNSKPILRKSRTFCERLQKPSTGSFSLAYRNAPYEKQCTTENQKSSAGISNHPKITTNQPTRSHR